MLIWSITLLKRVNNNLQLRFISRGVAVIMEMSDLTPREMRERIRFGLHAGHTSGLCNRYAQANLVILPQKYAYDFLLFCTRNPKACPLLDVTNVGDPSPSSWFAADADLRTDLPLYRIYQDGLLVKEVTDIMEFWQEDFVSFLFGCSFSFENALQSAGLAVRHIDEGGKNVPMYKTNIQCREAGIFGGCMVCSMRPFPPAHLAKVVEITSRYPKVHGSPVHIGSPELIGVRDLSHPDYGDAVSLFPGEVPVFWACGVTPQNVILQSKPCLAITHAPGAMFISDVLNEALNFS